MPLQIDYANLEPEVTFTDIKKSAPEIARSFNELKKKSGAGAAYLGWLDLPVEITKEQLASIEKTAAEFRKKCDVFIAIGIGGSYLGARAVIEALSGAAGPVDATRKPVVLYAGHHMSARQTQRMFEFIEGKDVCVNVISKSGTTTEPGIAFRLIKDWLENKYGEKATERIVATTDSAKGALHKLARQKGYKTFVIPDDVGGRFSVLTPVGLFPLAVAGVNIRDFVNGFKMGRNRFLFDESVETNPALFYAGARYALFHKGKTTEILANFEPDLHCIGEWWKQLYGESEGKNGRGLFPAAVDFSTDLHSLGQYIQDGTRNIFETFLLVKDTGSKIGIPTDQENLDGLNYLSSHHLSEINYQAYRGTALAHHNGGVPNMTLWIDAVDESSIGELFYFFELAVGVSGYLIGINPFDQPGVEDYKNNMFALLGKPGFEKRSDEISKKLEKRPPRLI